MHLGADPGSVLDDAFVGHRVDRRDRGGGRQWMPGVRQAARVRAVRERLGDRPG